MFARIAAVLRGDDSVKTAAPDPATEARFGTVCLMIEAACMDGHFDADERTQIALTLSDRFDLTGPEIETLMEEARNAAAEAMGVHPFAKRIRDHLPVEERAGVIEMMWSVALADGQLDPLEDQLIRRVAALIGVTDRERGDARKRAEAARTA